MHPDALYIWLVIAAITLATFLTRSSLHLVGTHWELPPRLEAALRYAPACALAAIVLPDLLYSQGQLHFGFDNLRLVAAAAAAALFLATRSALGTIVGGMAVFWILKATLT